MTSLVIQSFSAWSTASGRQQQWNRTESYEWNYGSVSLPELPVTQNPREHVRRSCRNLVYTLALHVHKGRIFSDWSTVSGIHLGFIEPVTFVTLRFFFLFFKCIISQSSHLPTVSGQQTTVIQQLFTLSGCMVLWSLRRDLSMLFLLQQTFLLMHNMSIVLLCI